MLHRKNAHTRERERVCDEQQHKNIVSVLKIVMPFVYSSFRLVNFFCASRRCLFDGTATSVFQPKTRKMCTRKNLEKHILSLPFFDSFLLFEPFRRFELNIHVNVQSGRINKTCRRTTTTFEIEREGKKRRLGCQNLRRAQLFHLLFRSTLDGHQQLKMPEKYPEKITLEIHFFLFYFAHLLKCPSC